MLVMQSEQMVVQLCICGIAPDPLKDYTKLISQKKQLPGIPLAWAISVHCHLLVELSPIMD